MKNLYETPDIYDLHYNKNKEKPLVDYYDHVLSDKAIQTILDVSIGSGNLTMALCDMGYQVTGSDLSEEMLKACWEKAAERGLEIPLQQADFRSVDGTFFETFDMVMSTGNSLPHVKGEDVRQTLTAMSHLVKPGGYLYLDIRNWDKIRTRQERFQYYPPILRKDDRVNLVLVRDFYEDHIDFNFLYAFEKDNQIIKTQKRRVTYYPLMRQDVEDILDSLGFRDFKWTNFIHYKIEDVNQMDWHGLICQKCL